MPVVPKHRRMRCLTALLALCCLGDAINYQGVHAQQAMPQGTFSPFASAPPATAAGQVRATQDPIAILKPLAAEQRRRPLYVFVRRPMPSREIIEAERQRVLSNTIAWQELRAKMGSGRAQYVLAIRFLNGDGVPQNLELGHILLRKAADNGFAPAEKEREARLTEAIQSKSRVAKQQAAEIKPAGGEDSQH